MVVPGYFRGALLHYCFRGVSKKFLENFRMVSREIQQCLKAFYEFFKNGYKGISRMILEAS